MDTNPYKFRYDNIRDFSLFVNGKQFPNEGLSFGMYHEKTTVMGYRTLFEGSGIHQSNAGHQITYDMFINDYLMLLFDLTPDRGASECHIPPRTGQYQGGIEIRQAITRGDQVPAVPRI